MVDVWGIRETEDDAIFFFLKIFIKSKQTVNALRGIDLTGGWM